MKLSAWAKQNGLSYKGAWRLWKAGQLPVPAEQLPSGTILVHAERAALVGVALYARVSSADQKTDLDRQLARLSEYAAQNKLLVLETVKEVGSRLNGQRRGLKRLLGNKDVSAIVVEHRDRLMRFGLDYVEAALLAQGRRLIIIDDSEVSDDIVRDMHEVLVSMCARLYGKRSAKNRAQRALAEAMKP